MRIFALQTTVLLFLALDAKLPAQAPDTGKLVDIGGRTLCLHCVGPIVEGGPTVILEAGAGGGAAGWATVQEMLAPRVRTCAYDRAGTGRSEPGKGPRTMTQEVFELHALLEAAQITGPYVLVGHSYGGLLARLFAERYEKDVVGVVLVDATHESCVLFSLGDNRWLRLRDKAIGRMIPEPKLAATVEDRTDYWPEELQQMHLDRQQKPEPLGEKPLIVLTGTRSVPPPPGATDEFWKANRAEKHAQQAELALLSRNALFVRDPVSSHNIPGDNPRLVVAAIERIVQSTTKGAPLVP